MLFRSLLQLPPNLEEVKGKETAQIAAEKSGFGSKNTYRDAKTVAHHAAPELAQAMDQGRVAISTAARLANDGASPPAVAGERPVIIFLLHS